MSREHLLVNLDSIQDQMEQPVGQRLQEMQNMEITGHKQW